MYLIGLLTREREYYGACAVLLFLEFLPVVQLMKEDRHIVRNRTLNPRKNASRF